MFKTCWVVPIGTGAENSVLQREFPARGDFSPRGHLAVSGHFWLTLPDKAAAGIEWVERPGCS